MIGYKIAKNGERRVVVTLEIPSDALTNMNRSTVAVKETAKYRTNKAKVLKIEDNEGNWYSTATSFNYKKKSLEYKIGEVLEEPSYNMDHEIVCAEGIHYFLSRRITELYGLSCIVNGIYEAWYDNGQKWIECSYVDGKICGLLQAWYENGQKWEEYSYVDGKMHGLYQQWNMDGTKIKEETYVYGVRQ